MKVYPYKRDDNLLGEIAIRESGQGSTEWDPEIHVIDPKYYDPTKAIRLESRVVVDLPAVTSKAIMPRGEPLELIALQSCQATRWSEVLGKWSMNSGCGKKFVIEPFEFELNPDNFIGKLTIRFILCLAGDRDKVDSSAKKKWNILARKDFILPEFPAGGSMTDWKSFKEEGLPAGLWFIRIPGNEMGSPASKIRVWLNSDNEQFRRLMSRSSLTNNDRIMGITIMKKIMRASLIGEIATMGVVSELNLAEGDVEGTCWSLAMTFLQRLFPADWNIDNPWASFNNIRESYREKIAEIALRAQFDSGIGDYLSVSKILNPGGN